MSLRDARVIAVLRKQEMIRKILFQKGASKMRRTVILVCCTTIAALILAIVYAQSNNQGPDIGFVVAALKNQLHASGKTLEVTYQYQYKNAAGDVLEVKYTRTPTRVMFIEIEGPRMVEQSSYNPTTVEVRRYELLKANGRQVGSISNELGYPLGVGGIAMDPVLLSVWEGLLLDKIGRGVMADSMESIDGHPCYRIDITPTDTEYEPYTVWVDPKIGYCPRQIVKHVEKPTVVKLSDYIDLGDGIWFPKKIVYAAYWPIVRKKFPKTIPSDTVELAWTAINVRLVETDSANPPIVQFPSGTKVTDEIAGTTFTVP